MESVDKATREQAPLGQSFRGRRDVGILKKTSVAEKSIGWLERRARAQALGRQHADVQKAVYRNHWLLVSRAKAHAATVGKALQGRPTAGRDTLSSLTRNTPSAAAAKAAVVSMIGVRWPPGLRGTLRTQNVCRSGLEQR